MLKLTLRYCLLALAVLAINFALPRFLPGDPLATDDSSSLPPLSAQQQALLRAEYRLDQPLAVQFGGYLADLAHGNLGWSLARAAPVSQLIAERLPWTLALVLTSTLVAAAAGTGLGLLAAWRGGRWDRVVLGTCAAGAALPEFLIGMLLLMSLALGLGWFPLQGGQTAFAPTGEAWTAALMDKLAHLALPAITLVVANLAAFVLLSRGAMRGVLDQPYLVTARGKGLLEWQVAVRHAAPNAVLPLLTLAGLRIGQVLGGAIVVERVFGVPGLGLFAFQSIQARDYPVLQAVFLLASLGVLLAMFGLEVVNQRLVSRQAD